MAKNIALTLTIGGVKQNITNIKELEAAIKSAEEELKGLNIGSEGFKRLSTDVKNAKSVLEDFGESVKGQDLEKRVGAFAKVGEGITASFAGAQAAIALFGTESEAVAEAAAKAQAVLTIALAARSAAEGVVAVRTVAANIATYASAAAANAATTATRVFEKLVKQYPGFNAFIDKENKLNKQGIEFIKLKIKQYELEAQAKLITQKIAENSIKILEIEQSSILDNVTWYEKLGNVIKSGGQISAGVLADFETGLKNQQAKIKAVTEENERWRKSLGDVYIQTDEVYKQLKPLEQTLTTQVETEKKLTTAKQNAAKTQEELNAAYKKGVTSSISFKEQLDLLTKSFATYEETIKKLENIKVDIPVIEAIKKVKEARIAAAQELVDFTTSFDKQVNEVIPPTIDAFGNFFLLFRANLEKAFTQPEKDIKKFDKILTDGLKDFTVTTQEQRDALVAVTQGYKDIYTLIETRPGFKQVIGQLKDLNVAWDENINATDAGYGEWFNVLKIFGDLAAATGEYKLELDDTTRKIVKLQFDPVLAKKNADETYQEIRKGLFKPVTEDLLNQKLAALEAQKALKGLPATQVEEIRGQIKAVQDAIKLFADKGELDLKIIDPKEIQTGVDLIIAEFQKLLGATVKAEQGVLALNLEFDNLAEDLANTTDLGKSLGGIVVKNFETLRKEFLGLRTQAEQEDKDFRDKVLKEEGGLAKFKEMLIKKNDKLRYVSEENFIEAYILFKKKEKEVFDETEKSKRTEAEKTLKTLEAVFQQFSTSLNMISSVTQERVRTDLESLKVAEQKALTQVVGDSKTAADKRLEIQAEYEEKRKEIEKRGRISALQFSLVQSIANAAQAITALWTNPFIAANPILGAIQTAVIAGVTAAQIGIIQDQISNAQAMRKGGLLKAQGGMLLRGPSHENGGIPLAQYGVIAEGNEAIINRQSTMNFQGLLSSINQSGGGRPLVMNNFDDSRIIEALAKQKQTPIRAYVLGSDITNEQMISKRLDDLSKFQYITDNAKRAQAWVDENGYGSCMTPVGKARLNQLAKGEPLSVETLKRMFSYISRHKGDLDSSKEFGDGCGYLAMMSWGEDGSWKTLNWLEGKLQQIEEEMGIDTSNLKPWSKTSGDTEMCGCGERTYQILQDGPCWEGYEMIGWKRNAEGQKVPNCVPKEELSAYELDVFGYKTKYFYICPGAQATFKDIMSVKPTEDSIGMIRSAAVVADKVFEIEADVLEYKTASEQQLSEAKVLVLS